MRQHLAAGRTARSARNRSRRSTSQTRLSQADDQRRAQRAGPGRLRRRGREDRPARLGRELTAAACRRSAARPVRWFAVHHRWAHRRRYRCGRRRLRRGLFHGIRRRSRRGERSRPDAVRSRGPRTNAATLGQRSSGFFARARARAGRSHGGERIEVRRQVHVLHEQLAHAASRRTAARPVSSSW